jgi:hypothetical protein
MPVIWQASSLHREPEHPLVGVLCGNPIPTGGRMPEERFCRQLAAEAAKLGLALIVFGPGDVEEEAGIIKGFKLLNGAWVRTAARIPAIVYDRRFCSGVKARIAAGRAASALRVQGASMLGGSLPGKLEVYRALKRDPVLRQLLPATYRFSGNGQLESLLAAHPDGLFMKPSSGMQGRGTLAISHADDGWVVTGRSMRNGSYRRRLPGLSLIEAAAARMAGGRVYVVQPLLKLHLASGEPFDIRSLVQKDGSGRWRYTGAAARIGRIGTATSNLHGGGSACQIAPFLREHFKDSDAGRLQLDIRDISLLVAERLELSFGRLVELGIDYGIEPDGRLWLLEANAKPGRAVFGGSGTERTRRLSVSRPLQYARYLMNASRHIRTRARASFSSHEDPHE